MFAKWRVISTHKEHLVLQLELKTYSEICGFHWTAAVLSVHMVQTNLPLRPPSVHQSIAIEHAATTLCYLNTPEADHSPSRRMSQLHPTLIWAVFFSSVHLTNSVTSVMDITGVIRLYDTAICPHFRCGGLMSSPWFSLACKLQIVLTSLCFDFYIRCSRCPNRSSPLYCC